MKFRVYGHIKDSKTADPIKDAIVKLYLDEEELQKGKSAENGFYEVIKEIEDSRIESGQQLKVTIEKKGYKTQEHLVLATEGSFNLDVKLETEIKEKKPFNWLPVIIAGAAVLVLLVGGVIAFLLLKPKDPKIASFSADPNSIEAGNSVTLTWKTKKAESVEILIDQNIVPVESSGSKKVQPAQTTEYILTARNKKGEVKESLTVEVKDIIPPELTMAISPSAPNMEDKVIFTATASDLVGISKIEILVNGTKVKECTDSPCTHEGGPYPVGTVNYEASAWDKSENKAVTDAASFTIKDTEPPEVTVALSPSTPSIKDRVTFTATAIDPGGISRMQIYVRGARAKECTGSPCEYEGGPYPLGVINYEVHAWDNSGNKIVAGPNSFTSRDIDEPEVAVTHSPPRPSTEDKVTFTAKAEDPSGIKRVQIYVNGRKVEECTGSPCKYIGGPYPSTVKYEARATDMSNKEAVTGSKSFTARDVVKPIVNITPSSARPSTTDKVTFTASAKDLGGVSKVQIYVNGKKVIECQGSSCKYTGGPYPLGSVSYYAYAYDNAGNSASTGSKSLRIIDKTPPSVSISQNPLTVNLNQRVTFTVTAKDAGGIGKVQIYVNGSKVKECTGSPCNYIGGPYRSLGNVRYEAHAYDKTGNIKKTGTKTFTVMNFNFETGNLTGWKRIGTAFNFQPTYGDNPTMRHRGQPSKHQGNYWIGTYEKHPSTKYAPGTIQGDGPTGTLTSNPFVIQSSRASFLVGGGSSSQVGVQLLVGGRVVMQARGKNTETMQLVTWDLTKYVNKSAQLRIFDNATGGWGHINFDDFKFVEFKFRLPRTLPPPTKTYPIQPLPFRDMTRELKVVPQ